MWNLLRAQEAGWQEPECTQPLERNLLDSAGVKLLSFSLIQLFFQYDAFYVAPNWTLFDVRRRNNNHSALSKLNFTWRDFPELTLESTHFTCYLLLSAYFFMRRVNHFAVRGGQQKDWFTQPRLEILQFSFKMPWNVVRYTIYSNRMPRLFISVTPFQTQNVMRPY